MYVVNVEMVTDTPIIFLWCWHKIQAIFNVNKPFFLPLLYNTEDWDRLKDLINLI